MDQKDRDQALTRFANKSVTILVATDVAARGLDIDALELVINYQLPGDLNSYIHRIGRTGRAGNSGRALTLVTDADQLKLKNLAALTEQKITTRQLPQLDPNSRGAMAAPMVTLLIYGGKKHKLRPGDILGALTGDNGIDGKHVGKIQVTANHAYVAVTKKFAEQALRKVKADKIKGKSFRILALT